MFTHMLMKFEIISVIFRQPVKYYGFIRPRVRFSRICLFMAMWSWWWTLAERYIAFSPAMDLWYWFYFRLILRRVIVGSHCRFWRSMFRAACKDFRGSTHILYKSREHLFISANKSTIRASKAPSSWCDIRSTSNFAEWLSVFHGYSEGRFDNVK